MKCAHPVLRILFKEDLSQLTSLTNAGIAPKETRTYMRQNTDTIATQQDIYNRIADARRDVCQGQNSINALAEGFWSQFQTGPDGGVKAVLFAHLDSVACVTGTSGVLDARLKRRSGERVPSMCTWCSHLGRACRKLWSSELHIVDVVVSLKLEVSVAVLKVLDVLVFPSRPK